MLTVCLHKLCVKDRLANAVRKVEKCVNIVPGGVENRPREGPKWPLGGLRRAGCSKAEFGRLLGALGTLLVALGPLWGPPGALLGPPGALLEPPGTLLGSILASRGSLFGAFWFLCEPMRNGENLEIR